MRGSGSPPWSALGGVDPFVGVVTPSHWSLRGFRRGGVAASRLRVVPHGVDPAVFRPASAARRTELRRKLGWKGRTVFLSVGSRIGSKGLPDLLRTFRPLHDSYPRAKLVLKLADSVYNSSRQHVELVRSQHLVDSGAIEYIGTSLSFEHMAELYQAADVYVSPYRGEGFNIPVLEAAACGLPVVVTKGGATEDFKEHGRFDRAMMRGRWRSVAAGRTPPRSARTELFCLSRISPQTLFCRQSSRH